MIGSLRGKLIDRTTRGDALVEVGGVGYRVQLSAATLSRVGAADSETFFYVYTHVREDALILYGFLTRDERTCFEVLLGAHGVGPALAMAIMSSLAPEALRSAVASDDVDALTAVPGVGKKTAAKMIIELKTKLAGSDFGDYDAALAAFAGTEPSVVVPGRQALEDVRAALGGLGYAPEEIRAVVKRLPPTGESSVLLRQALALLAEGL